MRTRRLSQLETVLENLEVLTTQEKEMVKGGGVIDVMQID